MGLLQEALVRLNEIPANERNRTNVAAIMRQLSQRHLTFENLAAHRLVRPTITDSYGRGLVHEVRRTKLPDASEILVVTMPGNYAPAIHDHGKDSKGAHLLAVEGGFYNITYGKIDAPNGQPILVHKRIERINHGDVAFIPGGHHGMHRVVNTSKKPHVSFNFYWSNEPGATLSPSAYVYDFGVGKGSRVTTGGPAFYFADGEDKRTGFQASALIKLEDLVLQHAQLFNAHIHGLLTDQRHAIFQNLQTIITGPEMKDILISARRMANLATKKQSEHNQPIAAEYFQHLFTRAIEMSSLYGLQKSFESSIKSGTQSRSRRIV